MASRWRFLWFVAVILSLVIGLPTFLTGCNTTVGGGCIGYRAKEGTIIRYRVTQDKCQRCGGGVCTSEPCYNGYGIAQYQRNHTCDVQGASRERTQAKAEEKTRKNFQLGETYQLFLRNGSSSCFVANKLYSLWLVGVICLSIGGTFLLALLVDSGNDYQMRRNSTIVPQQELLGGQDSPSSFGTPPASTSSDVGTDPGQGDEPGMDSS
jgi:hypothetical protein